MGFGLIESKCEPEIVRESDSYPVVSDITMRRGINFIIENHR
jgi:hypothetical protein